MLNALVIVSGTSASSSSLDWLWGLGIIPVLLLLVLWIAALVSIVGSRFPTSEKVLFALGALAFPLVGPLVWFLAVRRHDPSRW